MSKLKTNSRFLTNIKTFNEKNVKKLKEFVAETRDKLVEMQMEDISEEYCRFNFERAINCIKKYKPKQYESEITKRLLTLTTSTSLAMSQYYYSEELIEWILNLNIQNLFMKMITHYLSISDKRYKDRKYSIGSILITLTNMCVESMAIKNLKSGIVNIALNMLQNENFFDQNEVRSIDSIDFHVIILEFLENNVNQNAIKKDLINLNITERMVNHKNNLDNVMQSSGLKNSSYFEIINVKIVSILSKVLKDEQLEKLKISNNIVSSLLKMIDKTVNHSINNNIRKKTRFYFSCIIGTTTIYLYVTNFLICLSKIAINDRIKEIAYQLNILEPLVKILRADNDDETNQKTTAELILSLCFNENIKIQIKRVENIMNLIEYKASVSNQQLVVDACNQILAMVNDSLAQRMPSVQVSSKKHVMISYCHANKDVCRKLNSILKSKGYETWMDYEHPFNNILQAMANAVENASVVLLCYSEAYKMSPYCRLEAEYSIKCNKNIIAVRIEPNYKPDGWLGLALAMKIYVDFSNSNLNENDLSFIKLIRHINSIQCESQSTVKLKNCSCDSLDSAKLETYESQIKNWKFNDIKQWLIKYDLNVWAKFLKDYDGLSLLGLYHMLKNNYKYFCEIIDNEMKKLNFEVSLRARLKFYKILDCITEEVNESKYCTHHPLSLAGNNEAIKRKLKQEINQRSIKRKKIIHTCDL